MFMIVMRDFFFIVVKAKGAFGVDIARAKSYDERNGGNVHVDHEKDLARRGQAALVYDVKARGADTVGLVQTIHSPLSGVDDVVDNRPVAEVEDLEGQPDQEEDQDLEAKEVPGAFSREKEQEAAAGMMEEEGKRMVQS